jgi:hypothetical protein
VTRTPQGQAFQLAPAGSNPEPQHFHGEATILRSNFSESEKIMNIETLVREAVIQETPFKSEFLQRVYFSEYINFLN